MVWDILQSVAEIVFGIGGLYALYQCMRQIRVMVAANTVSEVWRRFSVLMIWSVVCCVSLIGCALVGGRALGVVFLATLVTVMVSGAGLVLALLRSKTVQPGGARPKAAQDGELVQVRSLVSGRVRGRDDNGAEVRFDSDEIKALVGVQGHVRMLNWASARKSGSQIGGIMPLMAFWSDKGDAFVLYSDDDVVIADGPTS